MVAAPEPASFISFGIGLILIGVLSVLKRRKNADLHISPA
ncbi:PEP-CTERM sorting domain-containing protein [Singulisphaera sp. GP187]|nr:PEP-CTERM sorting domain-containing protein [Singulisphaera sp. GP187]